MFDAPPVPPNDEPSDSDSDELESGPAANARFNGFESSDEEDFRSYDDVSNIPPWQAGLSAADRLAEEFDLDALERGKPLILLPRIQH